MASEDKESYGSSPLCSTHTLQQVFWIARQDIPGQI